MKKLSIYDWHLYPKCKALIHPGKIVDAYTCEFMIAWSSSHAPKPILKSLADMPPEDASSFAAVGDEKFSVIYEAHVETDVICTCVVAQVQTRGNRPRKATKYIPFDLYTPAQFRFLLENYYDVFGWIEKGLAVDEADKQIGILCAPPPNLPKAELYRRLFDRSIVVVSDREDAFHGPEKRDNSIDEMALYQSPTIAEAQTGLSINSTESNERLEAAHHSSDNDGLGLQIPYVFDMVAKGYIDKFDEYCGAESDTDYLTTE